MFRLCSVGQPIGAVVSQRRQTPDLQVQRQDRKCPPWSALCSSSSTQIYEGTNQIQRLVMARQLLKG
ncbi:hypothetical protein CU254_13635 [Amycolatopsis sp. AA4]|nr:hypothetical protein CU254_13635 [Amycolatopsis sp. AA4]